MPLRAEVAEEEAAAAANLSLTAQTLLRLLPVVEDGVRVECPSYQRAVVVAVVAAVAVEVAEAAFPSGRSWRPALT